jgi:hypothetical protein
MIRNDELAVDQLRAFVKEVWRRPAGSVGVTFDDQGGAHLLGNWRKGGAYGILDSDVAEFRKLLATTRGWRGDRLHASTWNQEKRKHDPCYCASCNRLRANLSAFVKRREAEELLARILGGFDEGLPETTIEALWYQAAGGAERKRLHRIRKGEFGICIRCPEPARSGKATCEACNDRAKRAMREKRARIRAAGNV